MNSNAVHPIRWLDTLGGMTLMLGRAFSTALKRPFELGAVGRQIDALGVRSLSIATMTAAFAGLVISIQFAFFLSRFGVQHNVGRIVSLTLFRELAPVLTALTVGGRIGAGITAELGSMKVTEQIDAIRMLGAEPLKKLVYPRVLACALVLPALTVLADLVGLIAGAAVVSLDYGISIDEFMSSALDTLRLLDFTSGLAKALVFGVIIGTVGCYKGFNVEGGSEGVGVATTQTVAVTAVATCLSDFFLTKILLTFS